MSTSEEPNNVITFEDEERLAIDIFKDYNRLIRPSPCHNSSIVMVEFGMAMILLINIDEKNQIMQTNVWLTFNWNDCQFNWNPSDYGGIESLRVANDRVWLPDIVLFNNADGNYEVSYHSNVVVDYKGNIQWVPPAIYKSSCTIDVEYFPMDQQICHLIFGSWTYKKDEVKLSWYMNKRSVELSDYSPSGIWDVMDVPGQLTDDKSRIHFQIVIRRKPLFYTVILIIPTVLMAFLSMMVFYLPAECNEKITLGTSILLALVVFLLLVSKILPPTSDTIPLMAKYLLLTFVLNILTIMTTVIIINIYFRSETTHQMPQYVRYIFLTLLPQILMMQRPERIPVFNGYFVEEYNADEIFDASLLMPSIAATMLPFTSLAKKEISPINEKRKKGFFHKHSSSTESNHESGKKNILSSPRVGKLSLQNLRKISIRKTDNKVDRKQTYTASSFRNPFKVDNQNNITENGLSFKKTVSFSLADMKSTNNRQKVPQVINHNKKSSEEESLINNNINDTILQMKEKEQHPTSAYSTNFVNIPSTILNDNKSLPLPNIRAGAKRSIKEDIKDLSGNMKETVEAIAFIAEHMKSEMGSKKVRDDWKYISMVMDRLLLLIFFGITLGGTFSIIFSAPHIFEFVDQDAVIEKLKLLTAQRFLFLIIATSFLIIHISSSNDEERLVIDLFRGYNHLIRPVPNTSTEALEVSFSLAMVLLINVDEKNQVMHTNVWLTIEWSDYQMQWDPRKYGQIQTIRISPDRMWLPDIVLFNNADGNYEVSFYSNVVVSHTGKMLWVPPAIYKSSCTIDVEYFPMDQQICHLIFGSWTYNENEVVINYKDGSKMVDLNDYSPSGIWDVMDVPGELIHKKSKIAYQIIIRRKALFYTVILIIPTILMAFLSIMVFYLPAEASEKITLAISILLALVVFLLLVSKILPPTSSTIPLMAKYLLLTFIMNIMTILVTVVIINIYFRGPTTHTMPMWVKTVFLKYLPLFLMMSKPNKEVPINVSSRRKRQRPCDINVKTSSNKKFLPKKTTVNFSSKHPFKEDIKSTYTPGEFIEMSSTKIHHPIYQDKDKRNNDVKEKRGAYYSLSKKPIFSGYIDGDNLITETYLAPSPSTSKFTSSSLDDDDDILFRPKSANIVKSSLGNDEDSHSVRMRYESEDIQSMLSEEALKAMTAVEYITEHLKQDNQYKKIREEWKYVAMVIDRILLYVFFSVTLGGTIGILFSAPNIFDNVNQADIIERLKAQAEAEKLVD
uniref:Neur_chan_LBD domain-containing protein n=1 Tax=Parastrongyloides trichosuri TaxID=131310 RepID=A0A0N4Z6Q5_PARTI